jgi:hypothetical protein
MIKQQKMSKSQNPYNIYCGTYIMKEQRKPGFLFVNDKLTNAGTSIHFLGNLTFTFTSRHIVWVFLGFFPQYLVENLVL